MTSRDVEDTWSDATLLQIDEVCSEFELAWTPESSLGRIRLLLDKFGAEPFCSQMFCELVATDCELRGRRGLDLIPEQFAKSFPEFATSMARAIDLWKETEFGRRRERGPSILSCAPNFIGDYEIVQEVGRGGTAIVYEAFQPELQRRVAVKVYALSPGRFQGQRERFKLEARAASRLEHENIVSVYDSGEENGLLFYVMQLVDGVSLFELTRARTDGPRAGSGAAAFDLPSPKRSAQMIAQAATALEFAHQRGVLHRDVKPSNLMLDDSGTIRLTDFGLARLTDSDSDLTDTGNIVGSLRYLPSEAFEGIRDERGDVYGLGLTLYELLTRQPAFGTKDRAELIRNICESTVRSPRQINDSVPADLDTITMKAIARDPADRYATAREMGDDLQRFLAGKPILARPVSPVERLWKWASRNPALSTLSALLMALVLIGVPAYLLMWQGRELDRVRADQELAEAALREEQEARNALAASALVDQERARAAGAAAERGDAVYAMLINTAQRAINAGDYAYATERLLAYEQELAQAQESGQTVEDRRDWEWGYLHGLLDQAVVTIKTDDSTFSMLRLSPDESSFVTVGQTVIAQDNSLKAAAVRLRDSSTGELLRTFASGDEIFCDAVFSPDGTTLATISLNDSKRNFTGYVRLWDVASGDLIRSRRLAEDYPEKLARPDSFKKLLPQIQYSSDGELLVASAPVVAFLAKDLEPKWQREGTRTYILPEGVAIWDGRVQLHDLQTGEPMGERQLCYTPVDFGTNESDKTHLLVGRSGKQVTIRQAEEDELVAIEQFQIAKSFWTTFTPDGQHVLRSEVGGDIVIQTPEAGGEEIDRLVGHRSPVVAGSFSRSSDRLVTADRSGTIKIWQLDEPGNRVTFDVPGARHEAVESLAFDDGDRLHFASSNFYEGSAAKAGWVRCDGSEHETFDIETTNHIFWPRHDISYSNDGRLLAAVAKESQRPSTPGELVGYSRSGRIHIWSTGANKILQTVELDREHQITAITWNHDKTLLAIATATESTQPSAEVAMVSVGDLKAPSVRWLSAGEGIVTDLAFTPNGQHLAAVYMGGRATLLATDGGGARIQVFQDLKIRTDGAGSQPSSCVDIDPSGRLVAIANEADPHIRVFEIASRELVHELSVGTGTCSVKFSPNGRRLGLVDNLSVVHLIDAVSGHPLVTLDGRSEIRSPTPGTSIKVVFSANGRRIAAPGLAGRITIWEAGETFPAAKPE